MGVKSAKQGYKVNGLTFPSKETFQKLMDIDEIFKNLTDKYDGCNIKSNADPRNSFHIMTKVIVIETYPDACEELDGLFVNATICLTFEDEDTSEYHIELYKLANISFLVE